MSYYGNKEDRRREERKQSSDDNQIIIWSFVAIAIIGLIAILLPGGVI